MKLAWGAHVSEAFRRRVIAVALSMRADPSHLMAVMHFETGGTFDPAKRNPVSGATGLIQFMPSTARGMGTTTDELARKTAVEQLDDVARYFAPYRGRVGDLASLYMAVLYPKAIGYADDDAIFEQGSAAYRDNAALDVNRDGKVTKAEAASFVFKRLADGMRPENAAEVEALDLAPAEDLTQPAAPIEDRGTPARDEDVQRIESPEGKPMAPLIGLAATIFSAFAPALQALITNKLGKVTGDPTVAGQVGATITSQVSGMILDAAKKATGTTSDLQAAAAVEADAQAQKAGDAAAGSLATAVAEDVASRLDALMPAIRDLSKIESEMFAEAEASRNAAAERAKTDTFDFAPILAFGGLGMAALLILFVCAMIIVQLVRNQPVGSELWAALTFLMGWITAKVGSIYDYRFGSSRGSSAKDALLYEMRMGTGNGTEVGAIPRGASKVQVTATK